MTTKNLNFSTATLLLALAFGCAAHRLGSDEAPATPAFSKASPAPFATEEPKMQAHFINVGQADATLLEFPCGAILVDAGAQDEEHADKLVAYLRKFFERRTDLNNVLAAVFITHPHKDHTYVLQRVVEAFTVKRFIDNGQDAGSGIRPIRWVRTNAVSRGITLRDISNEEVFARGNRNGITDATIDPLKCERCDPRITVLSGQWDDDRGWSESEFDNRNNHSLVIRVDFGNSSFLFTGDMEETGIESLLEHYPTVGAGRTRVLDVDVYHVGHHGSHNATTPELVWAMTPNLAVISMGEWNYGKDGRNKFTTWYYGHPRKATTGLLAKWIPRSRSPSIRPMIATAAKTFKRTTVSKAIYATGWDGNILLVASTNAVYSVHRNQ